jgi:hypothetical protein
MTDRYINTLPNTLQSLSRCLLGEGEDLLSLLERYFTRWHKLRKVRVAGVRRREPEE